MVDAQTAARCGGNGTAWPYQRTNVIANDVEAKREAMRGLGRGRRRAGDGPLAARRGRGGCGAQGTGGVVESVVEKCRRASRQTGCAMAWPNGGSDGPGGGGGRAAEGGSDWRKKERAGA